MEYKNNMMKIKPNCKKTKSCEECGKCKIKQEKNKESKKTEGVDIEKFRTKCKKKLRFLESFDPDPNQLIKMVEPIALSINSDADDETYNRIFEHPRRMMYHANEILKLMNVLNKEELLQLKICIVFHDIGKVVKFKKYNADMKRDHHVFSAIITETAMEYMHFDRKFIDKVYWIINNHNDKDMSMEECLEAPIAYRLLLDLDKIDENDLYGMILKSIVRGSERKVKRNNMINQKDLLQWIKEFNNDKNYDKLLYEGSKIYYNAMKEKIYQVIDMLNFTIDDNIF